MKQKILCLVMLLLVVCMVAGCTGGNTPEETGTQAPESDGGDTTAPDEPEYDPALDEVKFTDVEITFMTPLTFDVTAFEFYSEGFNDNPINNVIYSRNLEIEEKFGVKLNFVPMDSMKMIDEIRILYIAGDETNDIYGAYAYYTMELAIQNCYENLLNLEYFHADSEWWNQSYVEEITYNNQLYTVVGDMCTTVVDKMTTTFVNRDMMEDFGKEDDLFEVVNNGEWTLEYLKTLCKDVYESKDGGTVPTDEDTYGLILGRISQPAEGLLEACGFQWTTPKEEGISISLTAEKNTNILTKLQELFTTSEVGIHLMEADVFPGAYYYSNLFTQGRCMVAMGPMYIAADMRSTEIDYIILPLPKLDKAQPDYRSSSQDSYSTISISAVSDAKDASAAVLEYMSYLSRKSLTPAYCDTYYKVQSASDGDTMEMFDKIKDSVVFSFARVYSRPLDDLAKKMRGLVANTEEIASSTASYQETCQSYLEGLLMKLDGMGA